MSRKVEGHTGSVVRALGVLSALLAIDGTASAQTAPASPPSKQACFASHGKSQELRLDSKLLEARSELKVCSDPACPAALQTDCANWLSEVAQGIPTVLLLAESDSGDAVHVKVSVDGQPLTDTISDATYEFNPGAHQFHFELGDYPPIDQTVVLRQDEKRRVIRIQFQKPKPAEPAHAPAAAAATKPSSPPTNGPRPIPIATYVFGGLALAAAGASTYFGLSGLHERSDKQDSCSPNCTDEEVSGIKTKFLIADSTGAFAVLSAGLAVYFFATRPVVMEESDNPYAWSNRLRLTAGPNNLGASYSGSF